MNRTEGAESLLALFSEAGRAEPYPHNDGLRESAPIYTVGARRAVVTGYQECVDILRDSHAYAVPDREYADRTWPGWRDHVSVASIYGSLMYQNPPDNQPARHLLLKFFDRARVQGMRPMIERLAGPYVDSLAPDDDGGVVDATSKFVQLPDAVIGELAGIPEGDLRRLVDWLDTMLDANEFNPPGRGLEEADDVTPRLLSYIQRELLAPNGRKRGSLLDFLAPHWSAENEQGLLDTLAFVLGAGTLTTVSLLGSGLVQLARDPDLLPRLRDDDDLLNSFLTETVRYDPPVQYGARIAKEDTELHGVRVPKDTMLLVCFGAIGRDPRQFTDAGQFQVERFLPGNTDPKEVMSFGLGAHHCIGSQLGLTTGEIAFRAVARRYQRLRLAAPPRRTSRVVVRPFASLEIQADLREPVRS